MTKKPYVVVAGTDFSTDAARAITAAYEQARSRAPAELHVAHVAFAVDVNLQVALAPGVEASTLHVPRSDELHAQLLKHLDTVLGKTSHSSDDVRIIAHVVVDVPSFGLAQLASQLEADLLVVGSHGRHGFARFFLGSVSEGALRTATCPVLVIPPVPATLEAVPTIEPPCARCVDARRASAGAELWCEQHRERHGRRHTYYQADRGARETNMPMVMPER
ncbi:MAG TPA: universal stress protein [Polyangiaceae bacterium]|nr:universal stress protein [Polyangiaceae bacterium]